MIPETAHIYGLFDPRIPDVIWYVGKTNNFHNRLQYYRKAIPRYAARFVERTNARITKRNGIAKIRLMRKRLVKIITVATE